MDYSTCWYKSVCNQHPDMCGSQCVRYLEMYHLCLQSNLPEAKWIPNKLFPGRDIEAFRQLNDIKNNSKGFVESGNNLLLLSQYTGNGKSSWAIKIMLAYFNQIWNGNGLKPRGIFVPTTRLLLKNKESFKFPDEEYKDHLALLQTVDLVIWDDIGSIKLSDYDVGFLFSLIDTRLSASKSNIYTTNATEDQLKSFIGDRLFSRVYNESSVIEFVDLDKRGLKGGSGSGIG